MNMNKKKELIKNTIIIYLGRFCTQFISFFLVPIYTNILSPKDYGYIDLVQSYVSLLVPLIILRFDSSVFRFLIDVRNDEHNKSSIISNTILVLFIQIIIASLVFVVCNKFLNFTYAIFILINIISISISTICLQITRGLGNNLDYSISSIICGISTVLCNIVFITILKRNASYILLASSIGNMLCTGYIILKCKLYKYINIKSLRFKELKEMLQYSIPMIPDGLSWWIINASDRTIISFIIGNSYNGIFAISHKFANILSSISSVFNMTWQESASKYINSEDKDDFFSTILDNAITIFSVLSCLLMSSMLIIYIFFVGKEYFDSYNFIPILLLGNLLTIVSSIFGGIYIAKKETKQVAKTTIVGAILNIIIHLILIKKFKLWAAAISTFVSYAILTLYRYFDVQKYVRFKINIKNLSNILALFIITTITYYTKNIYLSLINIICICLKIIIDNKYQINKYLKKIRLIKIRKRD